MLSGPGEPSPAVAAFLLNDCKYSQRVFSRCLLDLGDRGVVRFDHQPDGAVIVSALDPASDGALSGYERVALKRLLARSRPGTGVPLSALVSDDGASFKEFRGKLTHELGAQAGTAGLAKRSSGGTGLAVLALFVSWVCAALVVGRINSHAVPFIVVAGSYASLMSLLVLYARRRWRPTPEGLAAANRWRQHQAPAAPAGPQRHAGGTAQPAASTTLALSSGGNAPLPRGQLWSSFGGRWHVVRAGPVYRSRSWATLANLRGLTAVMVIGTIIFVFFGVILLAAGHSPALRPKSPLTAGDIKLLMCAPAGLWLVVIAVFWLPPYLRLMAVPESQTFPGQVIKRWHAGEDGYYLAVDDGSSPTAVTFLIDDEMYQRIGVGDEVQVSVNPRLRRLEDIEVTAAAPR